MEIGMRCRVIPPQHEELQMPISTVGAERSRRQSLGLCCCGSCLEGSGLGLRLAPMQTLVNMMKIWLVELENKRMTSNKGWMHLVDGDGFRGKMAGLESAGAYTMRRELPWGD